MRVPPARLRLLVACGAAGGISATFNAPIAGVFFALELILRSFEAELFAVVVLASVAADVIGRAAFGNHPFLPLRGFHLVSLAEYPLYVGLGVLAALVGVAFIRVLYAIEDLCDDVWPGPDGLRPAVGGLLLGLLLLALPEMYGVGYPVLQRAISGRYVIGVPAPAPRREDARHQPHDRDRRLRRRLRAVAVHRRDARRRLRAGAAPPAPRTRRRPPAPTRWSAWARCSPPRHARRSPPCSSSSS